MGISQSTRLGSSHFYIPVHLFLIFFIYVGKISVMEDHIYIAIDLKSFYASVECRERGLNPLTTNLVVADQSRTAKTICLAVSPSLKAYGIPGRARLFEVVQRVREVNKIRWSKLVNSGYRGNDFAGEADNSKVLKQHPDYRLSYIVAKPRMALYLDYSTRIYNVYLRYVAPEDIHVYSIDEVFMDVTHYLRTYGMSAKELASQIICDILKETGITATAGIGSNLYLCKVAMDIVAKHAKPDKNNVRIAQLNEKSYRQLLWDHTPITDFWRVGQGYRKKLESAGLYTMGDIARCSLGKPNDYHNEELLYKMFGINAELLIDHAWGYEPVTIADVKAYKPQTNSISSGQVLQCPYDFEKAKLIVREMTDLLVLDLVDKRLVTDQIVLTIGYDIVNLNPAAADDCSCTSDKEDTAKGKKPSMKKVYRGEITTDRYGRKVPKHAHGTVNLEKKTSSTRIITDAVIDLYDRIVDPDLLVRRINVTANKLIDEKEAAEAASFEQLDLFMDYSKVEEEHRQENEKLAKERKLQEAMLSVKKKYGKNAMLKGMNLQEGATTISRNNQIGGHNA